MFSEIMELWPQLLGAAAIITVIVNILKLTPLVKDGTADKWSAGLNLLGLVSLFVVKLFWPEVDIQLIDAELSELANVLMVVLTYVLQLGGSKFFYTILRGLPIIGHYFEESA
jgi:hypothetical protein